MNLKNYKKMEIITVKDLKKFIIKTYHNLPEKKFHVFKVGFKIYMIVVNKKNELSRTCLYTGQLKLVNSQDYLKRFLVNSIEKFLEKNGYL